MSLYYLLQEKLFPQEDTPIDYTPQFRLEGRSRNPNNTDALAMRTADPLWMLGRQWQFGEFQGEDNGSPIKVKSFYGKEKASYYSTQGERKKINDIPLEARVEAVSVFPKDLKSKVRVGQQFERLIRANFSKAKAKKYIKDLRLAYPLESELWQNHQLEKISKLDEKSQRFFNLMKEKVIDGGTLLQNLKNKKYPKASSSNNDFDALEEISTQLKTWYENLFVEETKGAVPWNSNKMAHEFKVHLKATDQAKDFTLSAPDYQSGHLDWYSFDSAVVKNLPTKKQESEYFSPVNVSFASMPDKRLFSFEDSQIDLSMMDVDTADLLKLMLLDFSLVSGSDWYTIPLEMEVGELCWIEKIEVQDVFGITTTIKNDGSKGAILSENPLNVWDLFKIRNHHVTAYDPKDHFLFIPPAATLRMESEPIEELLFLRDEYANMVWALEQKIPNGLGKPVDGHDLHTELYGPFQSEDDSAKGGLPQFKLASIVPTNWIPYLPQHLEGELKNIELKRAFMMRNESAEAPSDIRPLTTLADQDLLTVREEAIPRAGVKIQLTKQRIRWTDGKTYVWMGRKVTAGRGEGNSGLRFDYLKEENTKTQ